MRCVYETNIWNNAKVALEGAAGAASLYGEKGFIRADESFDCSDKGR